MESLAREKLEAVLDELTVFCIYGSLADLSSVITAVIEERMADPVEMHTDLVGTSGLQTAFDYSDIAKSLKDAVMGHSMLSMVPVREHLEAHPVIRVAADVSDNGPLIILEIAPYDSHVATLDGMHEKLLCEIELSLIILRYNEQSRCILIDSMNQHSHPFILSIRTLRDA